MYFSSCIRKLIKGALPWLVVPVCLSVCLSVPALLNIPPTPFSAFQSHCFIYYGGALPLLLKQCKSCSRNVRDSNRYWRGSTFSYIYKESDVGGSSEYFGVRLNQ